MEEKWQIVDKRRTPSFQDTMKLVSMWLGNQTTTANGDGTYMHIFHHTEFPDAHEEKMNFFSKPLYYPVRTHWPIYMTRPEKIMSVDTGAVEWKTKWFESSRVDVRLANMHNEWTQPKKGPETLFESLNRHQKKYGGNTCHTLETHITGSSESLRKTTKSITSDQ